ncbi:hypothetical protein Pelo_17208 [Pelomyxa schiedti]|nr:hypothetical protein Pelo_17208 [Pelomyxa schiedti]
MESPLSKGIFFYFLHSANIFNKENQAARIGERAEATKRKPVSLSPSSQQANPGNTITITISTQTVTQT